MSKSSAATRKPRFASPIARLADVVVLPTPPLPDVTVTTVPPSDGSTSGGASSSRIAVDFARSPAGGHHDPARCADDVAASRVERIVLKIMSAAAPRSVCSGGKSLADARRDLDPDSWHRKADGDSRRSWHGVDPGNELDL